MTRPPMLVPSASSQGQNATPEELRRDPAAFADTYLPRNEKGRAWSLSRHQRRVLARAFRRDPGGELLFQLVLWGEMKKSGKTFLAAVLVLWWALTNADTEIIIAANDFDQSVSRVFRTIVQLIRHNPALAKYVKIRASELLFTHGTVVKAIANDYRGEAGARHSLLVVDEPWGIINEASRRLVEELTPPPTEDNAWVLMVTTAGFIGESELLEAVYTRGLAGVRVDDELELYEADGLFMFWSHTPRQPWQLGDRGERYYAEQGRSLRPATFARLHRNEWVCAESTFITPELWDACVDPEARPLLPTHTPPLFVGVDASTKHDASAVVCVMWVGDRLAVAHHRIWRPSPEAPLDLEATIEAELRALHRDYRVATIRCDPYQLHRSITTLQAAGLPIAEYPQTTGNTVAMGQQLFDLLTGRNLVLYPSDELRVQALATVGIESARGTRIAKEKASKKIDAIVALAMACVAAIEGRPPTSDGMPTIVYPDGPMPEFGLGSSGFNFGGGPDPWGHPE